jgi:hypothetical protein
MASIRRVRTIFSGVAGTPWYSNLYFTFVSGTAQATVDNVAAFWGSVDALMRNSVTWATEAGVPTIDDVTGDITSVETTTPGTGAGAVSTAELLPIQTQGLIHLLTGSFQFGRQVRGRIFVPGLTEAANNNGIMDSTTATSIQTAAAALVTGSSSPGPLRVFSRPKPLLVPPRLGTSFVVSQTSVPTKFSVLRSRRD